MNLLRAQPPSIFTNFAQMRYRSMSCSVRIVNGSHIKKLTRSLCPLRIISRHYAMREASRWYALMTAKNEIGFGAGPKRNRGAAHMPTIKRDDKDRRRKSSSYYCWCGKEPPIGGPNSANSF